jgi:hypothetical protein
MLLSQLLLAQILIVGTSAHTGIELDLRVSVDESELSHQQPQGEH